MSKISELPRQVGITGTEVVPAVKNPDTPSAETVGFPVGLIFNAVEVDALRAEAAATEAKGFQDGSQAWAEGTLPGGAGTKSAKEWATDAEGFATAVGETAAFLGTVIVGADDGEVNVQDPNGLVALKIKADGSLLASEIEAVSGDVADLSAGTLTVTNGAALSAASVGIVSQTVDPSGKVLADVDEAGHHRMVSAEVSSLFAARQFKSASQRLSGSFLAEINHIIWYGQSWALGWDSRPALTTTQPYDTLMFNGGVRQLQSVAENGAALQSFVPAVESDATGTPEAPASLLGETGAVAAANLIKEMILRENNIAPDDQSFRLLVSAMGEGGKSLEALADNAQPYMQRLKEQISRGYAIAQAAGQSYNVPVVVWIQGATAVNAATYAAQLEAMRADISAYAKSVTGQSNEVALVTWQAYASSNDPANSASAASVFSRFVAAADTYAHIYCAGPAYQHSQVAAGNLHYTNLGMRGIGQDIGVAIKRAVIDGAAFEPLRPVSLLRQGKIGLLRVNVEDTRLVEDTSLVAPIANMGLKLYDSGGTELTITSVSFMQPDTVKIVSALDIPAGAIIGYADTGTDFSNANKWRGTIRDGLSELAGRNRFLVAFRRAFDN